MNIDIKQTRSIQLEELIEKCILNDRVSQGKLFNKFYNKLKSIGIRYLKDDVLAQEVVQQTFIKVFDKLSDYDFKGSFEGWIQRIMRNACIDELRRIKRNPIYTDEEFTFNDSYTEQEHDFLNDNSKTEHIMNAINKLALTYQTVFKLYVIENYSHKEIAEILNINEGTSKSNLFKAKRNLRILLENKI